MAGRKDEGKAHCNMEILKILLMKKAMETLDIYIRKNNGRE